MPKNAVMLPSVNANELERAESSAYLAIPRRLLEMTSEEKNIAAAKSAV
jgi:hypothetical protein